jgi:hypothetical protein
MHFYVTLSGEEMFLLNVETQNIFLSLHSFHTNGILFELFVFLFPFWKCQEYKGQSGRERANYNKEVYFSTKSQGMRFGPVPEGDAGASQF